MTRYYKFPSKDIAMQMLAQCGLVKTFLGQQSIAAGVVFCGNNGTIWTQSPPDQNGNEEVIELPGCHVNVYVDGDLVDLSPYEIDPPSSPFVVPAS